MVEKTDLEKLTNFELTERYFGSRAELLRLNEQVHQLELAYSSKPSHEALAQLREARDTRRRSPGISHYRCEIIRRLYAPLKPVRIANSLSQGEVAKRAGLPRKTIQQIESGKYRANVRVAMRLWVVLGLDVPQCWESLDYM